MTYPPIKEHSENMTSTNAELSRNLETLFGTEQGKAVYQAILRKVEPFGKNETLPQPLNQQDAILITYGDQIRSAGEPPLLTLSTFCQQWLNGCINTIHILPFFPYSSDDGFSVLDYREVDPQLGVWKDIHQIGRHFNLMFDLVINHISAGSRWFQSFLAGKEPHKDFFITPPTGIDLHKVVRPRTSPLLTTFKTNSGEQQVWTTFSADQIDLDFHNPQVLLAILDVILDYAAHGASYLRLDAIAYLWKEYDTNCLNLRQTHLIIQIIRSVLDLAASRIRLITETNIPHLENISYFGDGLHEAQLVYNFALPPLMLHALTTGRVDELREWASTLSLPSNQTSFLNFLASHDGIGLNPARGILAEEDICKLVEKVKKHGGLVSYKSLADGASIPYELNINYFDALSDPASDESLDRQVSRFMVSQAVLLALQGVPAIYIHSLLGSRGWLEGPRLSGQNRSINRQKFQLDELLEELNNPLSLRAQVYSRFSHLLKIRSAYAAFSPASEQKVIPTGSKVFSLIRIPGNDGLAVVCCHNFSAEPQTIRLPLEAQTILTHKPINLIQNHPITVEDGVVQLDSYEIAWLASAVS
jgi:glucosylglycerate phosphorylase